MFIENVNTIVIKLFIFSLNLDGALKADIQKREQMATETLKITSATTEEVDYMDNKITDYCNSKVPFTQSPNIIFKNYVIKDNDVIVAGIKADIYYSNILYISILYVDAHYRGKN